MRRQLVSMMLAASVTACGGGNDKANKVEPFPAPVEAPMIAGDAKPMGKVTLSEDPTGVTVKIDIDEMGAGRHAVHLHEVGACTVPDFTKAGPHLNPEGKQHGRDNPQGSHLGDLANLTVSDGGTAHTQFLIGGVRLAQLIDSDGVSVVVHADPDDYRTDPSGNSGERIACAAFD